MWQAWATPAYLCPKRPHALGLVLVAVLLGAIPARTQVTTNVADFVDRATGAGLSFSNVVGPKDTKTYILETTGTGVAIFDYDNDGWPDLFFVNGTTLKGFPAGKEPTNHLFRNNHDGTFSDVTPAAGLAASGWGQGVCAGDFDNDGWEDLFVTYYGKNRLYHNRHGRFEEVAQSAGVQGAARWSTGCTFVDYDRDGLLDLFVAAYVDFDVKTAPLPGQYPTCQWKGVAVFCGPQGLAGAKNTLYRNLGNGRFQDVSAAAGIHKTEGRYCFTASLLDYDDDGWPDLYVACDSEPSILYHNNRDGTFTDTAVYAGAAYNDDGRKQAGMGVAIADYDGDGDPDICKTNFSDDTPTLYRNNADGTFSDVTFPAGLGAHTEYLGWGVAFLDFDNDTWPDLLMVNGHIYPEVDRIDLGTSYEQRRLVYRNLGGGKFADISSVAGAGISARSSARGLAVGDLWNDGRLSAVVVNMNDPPSLLVNQGKYSNHWIAVRTVGTKSNRDGIGARLELRTPTRVQRDQVRSGSNYISQSDIRVHFGLGAETRGISLLVRWPSGLVEQFDNLSADQVVTVTEGSGKKTAQDKR